MPGLSLPQPESTDTTRAKYLWSPGNLIRPDGTFIFAQPRHPAGSSRGGQFASKKGAGIGGKTDLSGAEFLPAAEATREDGFVYHATSVDAVFDIQDVGLVTHKPWEGTDQSAWPDGSTEKRSYFSHDPKIADAFTPIDRGPGAVLKIKNDGTFKKESGTGDLFSTKKVQPSSIEVLTKEGWKPLAFSEQTSSP
jgi:hypothetical protein